ncbi:hypothetical protein DICPUDRAFT_156339 [Dictyostelium purpureum]|uniref:OTU domain-containing protein n=1 Tax=Dictyostelium purpureum TaxID=5786 RepID=F0ZWB6_DICPU|nr:uncharacterized protein DICPUDRAFT_156339 [Dictyostelium purpureum]EGC31761.1 hypothetical protein DICPUDRAFT_156339 [Dictyostelium purpureum]|eukprot:XP_003291712.1 hypothetical protein DICPUDRAFT_156339 [Dictyostelium purpureum]
MHEFLKLCVYLFFGTICWNLPSFIGIFIFKKTKRNNKEKDDCQCWNSEDNYWAGQVLQQQEKLPQIQQIQKIQQTQPQEQQEHLQHLQIHKKLHLNQQQEHLQQLQQKQQNQEHQKLLQLLALQPKGPQQSQQPKQTQQPIPQQPIPQQPIPFIQRIRQQPQPQQPQQSQQTIPFIQRILQQPHPQPIHPQPTQSLTENAPIKPNEIDLSLVNSNGRLSLDPTPLNETEKAYIRLNERIELYQLMPKKEIPGDGNCQMHALSDQIFGDLEHSVIIRNNIVDWLRQNKGFYLPNGETLSDFVTTNSWEEYCDSMSKNGTWGDHLTLVAAAEIYKKNISIISSVESQSSSFIEITPSIKCENGILLSHFSEFHYGSLCPLAN